MLLTGTYAQAEPKNPRLQRAQTLNGVAIAGLVGDFSVAILTFEPLPADPVERAERHTGTGLAVVTTRSISLFSAMRSASHLNGVGASVSKGPAFFAGAVSMVGLMAGASTLGNRTDDDQVTLGTLRIAASSLIAAQVHLNRKAATTRSTETLFTKTLSTEHPRGPRMWLVAEPGRLGVQGQF